MHHRLTRRLGVVSCLLALSLAACTTSQPAEKGGERVAKTPAAPVYQIPFPKADWPCEASSAARLEAWLNAALDRVGLAVEQANARERFPKDALTAEPRELTGPWWTLSKTELRAGGTWTALNGGLAEDAWVSEAFKRTQGEIAMLSERDLISGQFRLFIEPDVEAGAAAKLLAQLEALGQSKVMLLVSLEPASRYPDGVEPLPAAAPAQTLAQTLEQCTPWRDMHSALASATPETRRALMVRTSGEAWLSCECRGDLPSYTYHLTQQLMSQDPYMWVAGFALEQGSGQGASAVEVAPSTPWSALWPQLVRASGAPVSLTIKP